MRWYKKQFCKAVFQLDRIPRYGRIYRLNRDRPDGRWERPPATWCWQKNGRWGMHLLMDLGLFWPYLNATQPYESEDRDATS